MPFEVAAETTETNNRRWLGYPRTPPPAQDLRSRKMASRLEHRLLQRRAPARLTQTPRPPRNALQRGQIAGTIAVQPAIEGLCALMSKCRQVSPHCRRRPGNNPVISAAGEPPPTAPPPPAPAASDRAPQFASFSPGTGVTDVSERVQTASTRRLCLRHCQLARLQLTRCGEPEPRREREVAKAAVGPYRVRLAY